MGLVVKIDGVLVDNRVRMTGGTGGVAGLPCAAWQGETMTAGLEFEDPDGSLDLRGWHVLTVDEDHSVVRGTRLFTGWLFGMRIRRGLDPVGPARVWECDIVDQNSCFGFEVFRANSAQRPAETDVARVEWARNSGPMAGTPLQNFGRENLTDNVVNLSATEFVTQFPGDLFISCSGQAGKNVYAYWDDDELALGLHYDAVGVGPAAAIAVSNVVADVDNDTVFYPFRDGQVDRDPSEMGTGVLLGYLGGYVYGRNPDLIDDLSPTQLSPVNFLRDQVVRSDRIGRLATANAYLARYLAQRSRETETLRFSFRVPAAKVNAVQAGDILSCRFSHLPSLDTAADRVVLRRTLIPTAGRRDYYDVTVECAATDYAPPYVGGGDPDEFPAGNDCDASAVSIVQSIAGSITSLGGFSWRIGTWGVAPTPGNVLVIIHGGDETKDAGLLSGWTKVSDEVTTSFVGGGGNGGTVHMWTRIADGSETLTPTLTGSAFPGAQKANSYLFEFAGVDALDTSDSTADDVGDTTPGVTITPTAGRVALILTGLSYHTTLHGTGTPTSGTTELYEGPTLGGNPQFWVGYRIVAATSGSYDVNPAGFTSTGVKYGSATAAFVCSGSGVPPRGGTWVRNELVWVGDGVTVSGTTLYHYARDSLRVFVDGVPIVLGLTQTDPGAGTFTLDFAPKGAIGDTAAERVTVDYQVAS